MDHAIDHGKKTVNLIDTVNPITIRFAEQELKAFRMKFPFASIYILLDEIMETFMKKCIFEA